MRLIDQLTKKRDEHLAKAAKYQELINFISGDEDVIKNGHASKQSIVAKAMKLHVANGNGNGNGHSGAEKSDPKAFTRTPAFRAKQAARMKKLWRTKRALMLKGVRRGLKAANAKRAEAAAN